MSTQRERAIAALTKIYELPPKDPAWQRALDEFEAAVGAASNSPPEGEADGSIDEVSWVKLSKIADALRRFYLVASTL